jgi:hypothetical protein
MLTREDLAEIVPMLRRTVALDASGLARVRRSGTRLTVLTRLPFAVLVARTIEVPQSEPDLDVAVRAGELLAWADGERAEPPQPRDADWRTGIPPATGWHRVDTVPDSEIRPLVRTGALTLKEAAEREGVPGAQPRDAVADALLDSVVLTVSDDSHTVEVTLRTLSALTRLGFLPRDSHAAIDVAGRWVRVAAAYGSVFAERAGFGLTLS